MFTTQLRSKISTLLNVVITFLSFIPICMVYWCGIICCFSKVSGEDFSFTRWVIGMGIIFVVGPLVLGWWGMYVCDEDDDLKNALAVNGGSTCIFLLIALFNLI